MLSHPRRMFPAIAITVAFATGCSAEFSIGDENDSSSGDESSSSSPEESDSTAEESPSDSDGSPSEGASAVPEAEVEQNSAKALQEQVGAPVTPDIDCPGDLEAKLDASMDCVLSVEGDAKEYPVTITVTEVNGADVRYTSEVGDAPL